jgi:hypothetical protein
MLLLLMLITMIGDGGRSGAQRMKEGGKEGMS